MDDKKLSEKLFGLAIIEIIMVKVVVCATVYTMANNPGSLDAFSLKFIFSVTGFVCLESLVLLVISALGLIKNNKNKHQR